jgi:hypothetical protein
MIKAIKNIILIPFSLILFMFIILYEGIRESEFGSIGNFLLIVSSQSHNEYSIGN